MHDTGQEGRVMGCKDVGRDVQTQGLKQEGGSEWLKLS